MLIPFNDILQEEDKDDFYQIQQFIPNTKTQPFRIYKTTERCVVKFTRILVGKVRVYFYEPKKNKRTDLSHRLGRLKSNIQEWETIIKSDKLVFMSKMVINWIYGQYIYPNIIQDIYQKFYYISDYGTILDYEKIIKPQYFLMKDDTKYSNISYNFIISDKEILSNNAKKFLEEYTFIKWKVEKM